MGISPLLQSHYLKFCSELVPVKACDLLNTVLVGDHLTDSSQAYRLINDYGSDELVEHQLCEPLQAEEIELSPKLGTQQSNDSEVIYGMFDGGQFLYDDGYHEVKVGRVFRSSQIIRDGQRTDNQSENHRNRVLNSEYVMQEGHYQNFVEPFGDLLDAQRKLYPEADLVFLTDGAQWMPNWVKARYPDGLHILDFYHAYERLCQFASYLIEDALEREEQLQIWKEQLKGGEVEKLISELKTYESHPKEKVCNEVEELLTYYQNNKHRMDYKTYIEKGYLIGSGAVESAVRCIAKQRCKLSGQRWNNGLQAVLNIRALYSSGKAKRMEKIISKRFVNAA